MSDFKNLPDIYFEKAYGKSTEFMLDGKAGSFEYSDDNGTIINNFLLREVNLDGIELDKAYYDIQSPYGYGGPVIVDLKGSKEELVSAYKEAFTKYCLDNNIICEFVRFHPLLNNIEDFKAVYHTKFVRKTVATVLKDKQDPFQEEFSKSTRKLIRKILGEGMTYEIIEEPDNLDTFQRIYYDTMDRNNASEYYYFDKSYFEFLLKELGRHIININVYYDDKCIASGLYFYYKNFLHAHLSGTDHNYLHLSPAYMLKYLTMEWGKSHGVDFVHYGGGTTNDPNDSLLLFKSKFTKEGFFDFYVGEEIYNREKYDYLVEKTGNRDKEYFPKYRG